MIVKVAGVTTKEAAAKLVGKKVIYGTGKKDMSGVVASAHGNSGALRVRFETGMPGQAVGQKVKILITGSKRGISYYNHEVKFENAFSKENIGHFVDMTITGFTKAGLIASI